MQSAKKAICDTDPCKDVFQYRFRDAMAVYLDKTILREGCV